MRGMIILFKLFLSASLAYGGSITTLDDIEFWTGTGTNRSALAIDWNGGSATDNSLVWGFRWNGTAKGIDLLTAIVMADDRLYAKIGPISSFGVAVVGLGYDSNNDGQFALDDETVFDEHGISDVVPSDGAMALDGDWYAEGWDIANFFWHYGVASTSPFDTGDWVRSGSGISNRNLTDGSWDSLAYTPRGQQFFAQNPLAAPSFASADFDGDGDVDGRDFLAWQRGFGITSDALREDGDADGNGAVDSTDLQYWSTQYGSSSGSLESLSLLASGTLESATLIVPEPPTANCLCMTAVIWSGLFFIFRSTTRRKFS